jgi:hypothetical protein
MDSCKIQRLAMFLFVGCSLLACASIARSQDSQSSDSVADAARRARENKKNAAKTPNAKTSKILTEDDMPKTAAKPAEGGVNVGAPAKLETQPPSEASVVATEAADQAAASGGAKKDEDPEIKNTKEQIAQTTKDLDLIKRELSLDQDTFYSNTDYVHDKAGQAKLADEQQQINVKQQELDVLKARLQDLEAHKKPSGETPAPKQ